MSDRLAPIPTPPAQRWRNIRLQYLPVLVFVIAIVAAGVIWTRWVAPPTLVGEAEAIRTELRSAQAGRLGELKVDILQAVTAGDVLGQVWVNEPNLLESSVAAIRGEMDVLRTTASLAVEQLHLDWLNRRLQLITLQGQFQQAEATLARMAALHRTKLITDEEFDQARSARDALQAQVKAQAELVARVEPGENARSGPIPLANAGLQAALSQKDQQLRALEAQLGPIPLIAPSSGIVTMVFRRAGEAVGTAEPILQITSPQSPRIVGFIRQPVTLDPKPGMTVEVRTRTFLRRSATTTIAQVGSQLEPVTPSLLAAMRLPVTALPTEFGLRIHVTPPSQLALRPGEHVDLIIHD